MSMQDRIDDPLGPTTGSLRPVYTSHPWNYQIPLSSLIKQEYTQLITTVNYKF